MDTNQAQAHEGDQTVLPGIGATNDRAADAAELEANSEPFSWVDDAADVAVTEQMPIAVYSNGKGGVVIRQRDEYSEPVDQVIVVRVTDAAALARSILDRAGVS